MTAPAAIVVLCTAPATSKDEHKLGGRELAQRLVEERLCACVNIVPSVQSCFRWEGRVESAEEMLLVVKTTPAAREALRARIVALHPYDVPEILELPVTGGLEAYLAWLAGSVAP